MKYQAKGLILVAVLMAAGSTLASDYLRKKPVRYARTLLAAAGLGFALSIVDTASDDVAEALAWLIIITSVLVNGQPIFDKINQATKSTGHTSPSTHYVAPSTIQA